MPITGLPTQSSAPHPACLARERWPKERSSSRPYQRQERSCSGVFGVVGVMRANCHAKAQRRKGGINSQGPRARGLFDVKSFAIVPADDFTRMDGYHRLSPIRMLHDVMTPANTRLNKAKALEALQQLLSVRHGSFRIFAQLNHDSLNSYKLRHFWSLITRL